MSISKTECTCADVRRLSTMCSAIFLRISRHRHVVDALARPEAPGVDRASGTRWGRRRVPLLEVAEDVLLGHPAGDAGTRCRDVDAVLVARSGGRPATILRAAELLDGVGPGSAGAGARVRAALYGRVRRRPGRSAPAAGGGAGAPRGGGGTGARPSLPATAVTPSPITPPPVDGTVSPSLTWISVSTPAAGDGSRRPPCRWRSRTAARRARPGRRPSYPADDVPSAIDSPICGITTVWNMRSRVRRGHGYPSTGLSVGSRPEGALRVNRRAVRAWAASPTASDIVGVRGSYFISSSTVHSSRSARSASATSSVARGPMMWTPRIWSSFVSATILTKPFDLVGDPGAAERAEREHGIADVVSRGPAPSAPRQADAADLGIAVGADGDLAVVDGPLLCPAIRSATSDTFCPDDTCASCGWSVDTAMVMTSPIAEIPAMLVRKYDRRPLT